ncbi:9860_t:CDS:2 [Gigaspora margarita]|uniref:9860_t:CDS:1 n=1 Tax=Gigaspora margarita TaxID=4874 RepID=A0ABN7V692_GIGMA|nr:9860_t:CDS:2 [Gigaspora margarita]
MFDGIDRQSAVTKHGLISDDVDYPEIIDKSKILDTFKDFLPTSGITPPNLIDNNKLNNDILSV